MVKSNYKNARMEIGLQQAFSKIAAKRYINGLDKRASPIRVQKKIQKHALWPQITKDLEIANFLDDDTGQVSFSSFNIFTFGIIAFMAIIFFAGLIWVTGILSTTMHNAGLPNEVNAGKPGYTNMTLAADQTFGQMNNSIQALRLVALCYIFAMIIATLIVSVYIPSHPVLWFVYICIAGLAVLMSVPVSNAYETILNSNIYDGILNSFVGGNYIMLNLPTITAVIGILGSIFMFINVIRVGGTHNIE